MMFDPMYFLFVLPALVLAMWAQSKIKNAYQKNSRLLASRGVTGKETARLILAHYGLDDVPIEISRRGALSDHYDPRDRTVRLSPDVFDGRSLAAVGIAAHEVGHAVQHATGYAWLGIRNAIIPVTQLGSRMAFPLFFIGLLIQGEFLMTLGILLFGAAVAFQLITLPVEYNASSRAVRALQGQGIVDGSEIHGVREVLDAAALTYLAAALMAAMQFLYLIALRGRRR